MDASLEERISGWFTLGDDERRAIARLIAEQSDGQLALLRMEGKAAIFLHRPTGVLFHLIPGGRVALGFDDDALRRLREQYQYWDECDEVEYALERFFEKRRVFVSVKSFLLGALPLSSEQLQAFARGEITATEAKGRRLPDLERVAKMSAPQWVKFLEDFAAGTFSHADIGDIEASLARFSLRLPSDAEREFAARALTDNLFPHGDSIPRSPNIGPNPLGLLDLGSEAEVCADAWMPSIDGIPPDGSPRLPTAPDDERVIRGGAASCYPWQGCAEWTLLLCSSRSSSKSNDGFLVLRPALSL